MLDQFSRFRLRTKILIAIVFTWLILLILGFIESRLLLKNYINLENLLSIDDIERAQNGIDKIEIPLQTQVANWAVWDDAYKYMSDKNKAFIDSNLMVASVAPTAADMMLIYDLDGNLVFQIALNSDRTKAVPIPPKLIDSSKSEGELWKYIYHPKDDASAQGLFYTNEGLVILALHSILKSDGTGPTRGTWIFVKHLDQKVIDQAKETTKLNFEVYPISEIPANSPLYPIYQKLKINAPFIDRINGDLAYGYQMLNDINDEPVAVLKVYIPRIIYKTGLNTIYYFNLILIASGIIFAIILFFMMRGLILKRLKKINFRISEVAKTNDYSIEIPAEGSDEISSLGVETNKMLSIIRDYDADNKNILKKISHELEQSNKLSRELNLAEAFLTDIINSMPFTLIIADENLDILQINRRAELETSIKMNQIKNHTLFELLPFMEKYKSNIDEAIKTNTIKEINKIPVVANDKTRYFNALIFPLTRGKNISVRIDDVTEISKLQEKMLQSDKLASIGVLTAGVMHEINNPVNFVLSAVSPLKNDLKDIDTLIKKYQDIKSENNANSQFSNAKSFADEIDILYILQEVAQLIEGMKDGINRTVMIAKGLQTASKEEDSFKPTDVHQGLDSTLILLNHKIKGKVDIIKHYGDIPLIYCNPDRLNQVFMNLLSNAIDAIIDKGEIQISTLLVNNNQVRISIKDNGSGISPENISKIWDPFFTSKAIGKGTGLGLSITRKIIEEINGTIEMKSELGKGTEFIINLVIKKSDNNAS